MLKLDVEGVECHAIIGARRWLAAPQNNVVAMLVEYSPKSHPVDFCDFDKAYDEWVRMYYGG